MSLDVKLEDDDRKFIDEAKSAWKYIKKQMTWLCIAMVLGFLLGKLYTWDSILTDCKVLGMTRFHNTPMGCKVGEKY